MITHNGNRQLQPNVTSFGWKEILEFISKKYLKIVKKKKIGLVVFTFYPQNNKIIPHLL